MQEIKRYFRIMWDAYPIWYHIMIALFFFVALPWFGISTFKFSGPLLGSVQVILIAIGLGFFISQPYAIAKGIQSGLSQSSRRKP